MFIRRHHMTLAKAGVRLADVGDLLCHQYDRLPRGFLLRLEQGFIPGARLVPDEELLNRGWGNGDPLQLEKIRQPHTALTTVLQGKREILEDTKQGPSSSANLLKHQALARTGRGMSRRTERRFSVKQNQMFYLLNPGSRSHEESQALSFFSRGNDRRARNIALDCDSNHCARVPTVPCSHSDQGFHFPHHTPSQPLIPSL